MSTREQNESNEFVERLRAPSSGYHIEHEVHRRMNKGELSPDQIRGWVAIPDVLPGPEAVAVLDVAARFLDGLVTRARGVASP